MHRIDKLTKKEQEALVFDLVHAFVQTRNVSDAALFLQDLLTKNEMKVLSKRLRIAKLLIMGMTYEEIERAVHASHGTVAKIAMWLSERGEGFRNIIEKLPKSTDTTTFEARSEWDSFKGRYSLYFWPELLLEEIVKSANKKQKERITTILDRLEEKSELHKRIETLIKTKV